MKTTNIKIDFQSAKDWHSREDKTLKEPALKAFTVKELAKDFRSIKTFEDACKVLDMDYARLKAYIDISSLYSHASAAMFKLNIIRKALNLGTDLHLTKDPKASYIYYPCNPFTTIRGALYQKELNSCEIEVIGNIRSEGVEYVVLGGSSTFGGNDGLGNFASYVGVGAASADFGFLGCASKEIAQHFGKYFGMLITEAKYGDMVDFKITEDKYGSTN